MEIIGKTTSGGIGTPPGNYWIIQMIGRTVHVPTTVPEADLKMAALQQLGLTEAEATEYQAACDRLAELTDFTPTAQLVADLVTIVKVLQR